MKRLAFVAGCSAVTGGVALHLPMLVMAWRMGGPIMGMPMDGGMIAGMGLIVAGFAAAAYGLLPPAAATRPGLAVAAPEDAPLSAAHWLLMGVLTLALVIDIMKPASLGFTIPGMAAEYHATRATVSLVPFFALIGTVTGSIVWGIVADLYGRKATILLSAVMFVGTSICGAMPSLAWNIAMCFMMGAAAGGMLPVTYALLAEMMPNRHRGWSLVLVGGVGAAGGYFAASGLSAWAQPVFGWRILWLANLPTGLALVGLGALIPESARFLIAHNRLAEAEAVMRRFGGSIRAAAPPRRASAAAAGRSAWTIAALSAAALTWGLVNFGLLLWLPADLVDKGYPIAVASALLAQSALIALPTVVVAALLYSRWSSKGALAVALGVTLLGLAGVFQLERAGAGSPVGPVALLIVGTNALIAILLPFAAESFALAVRARATGWVAACTKAGGVAAQLVGILGVVLPVAATAALLAIPAAAALGLTLAFGGETRGRDLRDLDRAVI